MKKINAFYFFIGIFIASFLTGSGLLTSSEGGKKEAFTNPDALGLIKTPSVKSEVLPKVEGQYGRFGAADLCALKLAQEFSKGKATTAASNFSYYHEDTPVSQCVCRGQIVETHASSMTIEVTVKDPLGKITGSGHFLFVAIGDDEREVKKRSLPKGLQHLKLASKESTPLQFLPTKIPDYGAPLNREDLLKEGCQVDSWNVEKMHLNENGTGFGGFIQYHMHRASDELLSQDHKVMSAQQSMNHCGECSYLGIRFLSPLFEGDKVYVAAKKDERAGMIQCVSFIERGIPIAFAKYFYKVPPSHSTKSTASSQLRSKL